VGSAPRPGRSLPPGKTRYPLCRRLGGFQDRSGQVLKISPPTAFRTPDRPARSQSLVSCLVCIDVSCLVCIGVNCLVCIVVNCLVCIVVNCLVCIVVSCLVCIVVVVLCVLLLVVLCVLIVSFLVCIDC